MLLGLRFFLALINLICRHELNMCDFFNNRTAYSFLITLIIFSRTWTFDFFSDRWSVSGSSNSEYHYLSNVYGEGFFRAIYDVQCCRTEHSWHSRGKVCSHWRHLTWKYFVLIFHEIQLLVHHLFIMEGIVCLHLSKKIKFLLCIQLEKSLQSSFQRNYS